MKSQIRSTLFVTGSLIAISASVFAAPLNEAQITHIIKDVRTLDPAKPVRPAKLREILHSRQSIRTGIASRTELLFNDQTLTRIGANSHFSFTEGTRNLELYRGVILLQVPKRAGGARIHTAAITAAITGTTILLEAGPGYTKFIVVEGNARVTANNDKFQRKTTLRAGQAVIMPSEAKQVPPPVVVNLAVLVKTSRLISGEWPVELNAAPITAAIAQQKPENFTPTNIAIIGPGTEVVFLGQRPDLIEEDQDEPTPDKFGAPATIVGTTVITSATQIKTDPTITSNGKTGFGKIYRGPAVDGPASQFVFGNGSPPQPTFDTEFEKLTNPAVFRFESLRLQGGPDIDTTGGPTALVLASLGAIASGGAGQEIISLSQLNSLTLAALGPISLDSNLTFTGSNSRLWLTNQGSGNAITVNSAINLSGLRIDSAGNLSVAGDATIQSGIWSSGGDLQVAAPVSASGSLQIQSAGSVTINAPITTPSFDLKLTRNLSGIGSINAGRIVIASGSPLSLSQTVGLSLSGIAIDTGPLQSLDLNSEQLSLTSTINFPTVDLILSGTAQTPVSAAITARNLTLTHLTAPGSLTLNAATGTLTLNGGIVANDVTATVSTLAGTGSITASQVKVDIRSLNPLALSQSTDLRLNGVILGTGQLQRLDLTADQLTLTSGGVDLPAVDLVLSGTVRAPANASLTARNLTVLCDVRVPGNVTLDASGDLTLLGSLTASAGRLTSGGNLNIGGLINPSGVLEMDAGGDISVLGTTAATELILSAGGEFKGFLGGPGVLSASKMNLASASPGTFMRTAPGIFPEYQFGALLLDLTGTANLTLSANPLQILGAIDLPAVDLVLNGNVETALNASISARNLTITGNIMASANSVIKANFLTLENLTVAGPVVLEAGGGEITVTGAISGNNTLVSLSSTTVNLKGAFTAPTLDLRYQGTHFTLGQTIQVDEFRGTSTVDFSSAPGAKIDAANVILNLVNSGLDLMLSQPATGTAAVAVNGKSLTFDLARTTALEMRGGRNFSIEGDFNAPGTALSLGNGAAITRINGNLKVAALGLEAINEISINGTITSGDVRLSAGKSFSANSLIVSPGVVLTLSDSPATLSQVGNTATFTSHPAGLPDTTLQFDTAGLGELSLTAAPLTIGSGFSLTSPATSLSFRQGTITALGTLSVAGSLRLGIEVPANLIAAGNVTAGLIFPPRTGSFVPISIDAASLAVTGGVRFGGVAGTFSDNLARPGVSLALGITGAGDLIFSPGGINGANFSGGGNLDAGVDPAPGTNPDPRDAGNLTVNAQGNVTVNVPITATTGRNVDSTATGGAGGTMDVTSQNGTISVNSTIEVSSNDPAQRRKSAKGGNIRLTSRKTTGTAITINSSGELKALLDAAAPGPGGEITFISDGGDILFNGGKVTADRGTIDVRNNGPTGLVHLNGATLAADVVKIGALGSDGVLRIGGGSIDANTTIKLYAGGSNGTVDFVDNVTLSGSSVKSIAARTVNITNGKVVIVSGPAANVYTTHANYSGSGGNGSKTGTFSGSGASTSAFDHPAKPPF